MQTRDTRSRRFTPSIAALVVVVAALLAGAAFVLSEAQQAPESSRGAPVPLLDERGGTSADSHPPATAALPQAATPAPVALTTPLASAPARAPLAAPAKAVPRGTWTLSSRTLAARFRRADGSVPTGLVVRLTAGSDRSLNLHAGVEDEDGLWWWRLPDDGPLALRFSIDQPGPAYLIREISGGGGQILEQRLPQLGTIFGTLDAGDLTRTGEPCSVVLHWRTRDGFSGGVGFTATDGQYRVEHGIAGEVTTVIATAGALCKRLAARPPPVPDAAPPPPSGDAPDGWRAGSAGEPELRWDIRVTDGTPDLLVLVLDADDGKPIGGADVRLGSVQHAFTGDDGSVRFPSVAEVDRDEVKVSHRDYLPRRIVRDAPDGPRAAGGPRLVVHLEKGGVPLSGWVYDQGGQPLSRVRVRCSADARGKPVETDAAGAFRFEFVARGLQRNLHFESFDAAADYLIDVPDHPQPQVYTLGPRPQLKGRVLRADGRPWAGAQVLACRLGDGRIGEFTTADRDGRFAMTNVKVGGQYAVYAHSSTKNRPVEARETAVVQVPLDYGRTADVTLVEPAAPEPAAGVIGDAAPLELQLRVIDARSGAVVGSGLEVTTTARSRAGFARDGSETRKLQPGERTLSCPRTILTLEVKDPEQRWPPAIVTADGTSLADGSVIDVLLDGWR